MKLVAMIYPTNILEPTTLYYLPQISKSSRAVYLIILLSIILILLSLPFIYTTISIKSEGIIRPINERTELKALVGGIIDSIFFKEGQYVQKGQIILRIKDPTSKSKIQTNQFEINQEKSFVHDLIFLTSQANLSETDIPNLTSPIYKEQLSRYLHQKENQEASLKKANEELVINNKLAIDKVISPKELFDSKNNEEKNRSTYYAFLRDQQSIWQQDLNRFQLKLSQLQQEQDLIKSDASKYVIRVPISGIVQGISNKYTGGLLQPNEIFCSISPEGTLIGECYVQTKDIGLLKLNQPIQYQIEAFDYKYFGFLTGKILSIDNDFTISNNTTVFKVRCGFDEYMLPLKNGYKGQLKKGLKFQARFMVARRSLWQLLFDKMDNWVNPNLTNESPSKSA